MRRLATLLRRWADRLDPPSEESPLSVNLEPQFISESDMDSPARPFADFPKYSSSDVVFEKVDEGLFKPGGYL